MTITLLESHASLGETQRALVDLAGGLRAYGCDMRAILGAQGPLATTLASLGVPVEVMPMPEWVMQGTRPTLTRLGWQYIRQLAAGYRATGSRLLLANSSTSALLGVLAGGDVCWRVHSATDLHQRPIVTRWAGRLGARVWAATPTIGEAYVRAGGDMRRLTVMPPGIDLARYAACDPPRTDEKPPVVGLVASWEPRHGQEVLVKAVRLLQEGGHRVRVHLAGEASTADAERYRSVVAGIVKVAGLGDRLTIAAPVPDQAAFLAACDVVVIPALGDANGRTALEAAAIGRPVVASRIGVLPEVIEDGRTGLLVPPNHPRALADALALLVASPALRVEMGRQARLHVCQQFDGRRQVDAVMRAFGGASLRAGTPSNTRG